jgi:hypothetical protein
MSHFALLLLPVLSKPGDYTSPANGFDAAGTKPKKRKRSHSHTTARCTQRQLNEMTPEAFDKRCRALAKEEIIKTLKLAEQLENEWGSK